MFKKFLITINIALIFSLVFSSSASAFSYPSPSSAASQVMSSLGVNQDELRYSIQSLNVSRQKKNPPSVSVSFYPSDPTEGTRVTAQATPTYFMNDTSDLYFTWFLKTDNCPKAKKNQNNNYNAACDHNGDDEVDVEDWKIKAMRIIVNDDFDWENTDYSQGSDDDGYEAFFGGDDQGGKAAHCYVHDTSTGDEYEIKCKNRDQSDGGDSEEEIKKKRTHLFPHAPHQVTGDNDFGREEEEFWRTDPNSDDTARTGNVDEANVAGLGRDTFSWNYSSGDEIGVVVEGVSVDPAQSADSAYRTMWAMPKSMCDIEAETGGYPKVVSREIVARETDKPNFGQTAVVTKTTTEDIVSRTVNIATIRSTVSYSATVVDSVTGVAISPQPDVDLKDLNYCNWNTNSNAEFTSEPPTTATTCGQNVGPDRVVTLDPNDISLSSDDEEMTYPSDLNECLYSNLISPTENALGSERLEIDLSYSPTSPINDPNDPDEYADPSFSTGDFLTVNAAVLNAGDADYLQYKWEVFAGNEVNPDSWGDAFLKADLPESTQMEGLGLDTFKFRLNFQNAKRYFRIKLTVKENVGRSVFREGHTDVIIPISSADEQIQIFPAAVSADASSQLSLGYAEICQEGRSRAVCPVSKNEIMGVTVPTDNLTDFLWTIDGEPFTYQNCFFEGCLPERQIKTAYFPILKEKGERYTVNLVATKSNGERVNLSRILEVADPVIKISSADETNCKPVLLGSYLDLDGISWPDYSELNFWALTNYPIKLAVDVAPLSVSPSSFAWSVDGNTVDALSASALGFSIDNDGILTLPPKDTGQSYDVSVATVYSQNEAVRKALNKHWGVAYDQFYEKVISDSAIITMQDSAPLISQSPVKKIFASVYLALPEYLAFLLRMVLTAFLILFISRLVLSFSFREE